MFEKRMLRVINVNNCLKTICFRNICYESYQLIRNNCLRNRLVCAAAPPLSPFIPPSLPPSSPRTVELKRREGEVIGAGEGRDLRMRVLEKQLF